MVGHLDHDRSAAGQAPRRAKTGPWRGPGGQPPPQRKGGQERRGHPWQGNHDFDALNFFYLLWPFRSIARRELFRTSQNK